MLAKRSTKDAGAVAPIVLAAGGGRRFPGKLLAPLGERPLLARTLDAVRAARARDVLADGVGVAPSVEGAIAELLRQAGLEVVVPDGAAPALAESLRAGVAALDRRRPPPAAALVVLGDQPTLRADVIAAVVAAWRAGAAPVVRPVYAGAPEAPGHPVLLARSTWWLARHAPEDAGLLATLRESGTAVHEVAVDGVNPDVDVPADLAALTDIVRCARS